MGMFSKLDDIPLSAKGFIVTAVPTLVATLFIFFMGLILFESQEAAHRETRTKDILFTVQRLGPLGSESMQAISAFVLTRNQSLQDKNRKIIKEKDRLIATLEKQLKEEPAFEEQAHQWLNILKREFLFTRALEQSVEDAGDNLGILVYPGFKREVQMLFSFESKSRRAFIQRMSKQQHQSRTEVDEWDGIIVRLIAIALAVNLALGLLLATYYSRGLNRRLARIMDNANKLASDQELNPVLPGRDEIGRLDRTFHKMAIELQEAAFHEKAIVDNAADVISTLSDQAVVERVNAAVERTWGYKPDDLLDKKLFDIIHPDDIAFMRAELAAVEQGKGVSTFESRLLRREGSVIHVSWAASWLEDERNFYLVAHDITQRKLEEALLKESEQTIRLVLEGMPVGLLILDQSERIEATNISTKQLSGYKDSEIRGQPLTVLFANAEQTETYREFRDTVRSGTQELLLRKKDGYEIPVELNTCEFALDEEAKTLIVVQDITLRHEVERLKKEFVAMVSHDLRTPLTTILASLQLLQEGPLGMLNAKGKEQVSLAEGEAERLITLVNTLLDIEKFEAGQMELHKEPADIATVVSHSINTLRSLSEKSRIELAANIPPLTANVDSAGLTQVLVNLIGNAIKFSAQQSRITVSAQTEGSHFVIKVEDQGRGIPETLQQTIFERFKQVDTSDRTEKKGSGLGLSICKLIVESHGGEIGVESTLGRGSTFWFRIPTGL